jgi:hypothetical protein
MIKTYKPKSKNIVKLKKYINGNSLGKSNKQHRVRNDIQ